MLNPYIPFSMFGLTMLASFGMIGIRVISDDIGISRALEVAFQGLAVIGIFCLLLALLQLFLLIERIAERNDARHRDRTEGAPQ
ncbi:MAG: hypothetical protein RLW87_20670 [Alphaproteobacteria bacterium]